MIGVGLCRCIVPIGSDGGGLCEFVGLLIISMRDWNDPVVRGVFSGAFMGIAIADLAHAFGVISRENEGFWLWGGELVS